MKRSKNEDGPLYASAALRKNKAIQACTSCRTRKTRCEIIDTTTSPIRCHRCHVVGVPCSYETLLLPSISRSESPASCPWRKWRRSSPSSQNHRKPSIPAVQSVWDFVSHDQGPLDWSAPMLVMEHLIRDSRPKAQDSRRLSGTKTTSPRSSPPPHALSSILTTDEQNHLLGLFEREFAPWLNFNLIRRSPVGGALLDTICCTVAARYLPPTHRRQQQQLSALADDLVVQILVKPRFSECLESIQALVILALWAPPQQLRPDEGRDARSLVGAAVSMSLNMRLDQAAAKAEALRMSAEVTLYLSAEDMLALKETTDLARLWLAVTNTESLLSLGTGRIPVSRRSDSDMQLVQFPQSIAGITEFEDLRLGIVARASSSAQDGTGLRISSFEDVDEWLGKITEVLDSLTRVQRFLSPLSVVLDRDQSCFHLLRISDGFCRLLVLYHAFGEAQPHIPTGQSRPAALGILEDWCNEMVHVAESMIVYALQADARVLGRMPDTCFVMLSVAAGYLLGMQCIGHATPNDLLVSRLVTHLECAVPDAAEDYLARGAADFIRAMVLRQAMYIPQPPQHSPASNHSSPSLRSCYLDEQQHSQSPPMAAPLPLPLLQEIDYTLYLDQAAGQFWQRQSAVSTPPVVSWGLR